MRTETPINERQDVIEARMSAAIAVYYASMDGHGGQCSNGYEAHCIISAPGMFTPSPLWSGIEDANDYEAEEIYDFLINDESLMLQYAEWLRDGYTLHDMINSEKYQKWEGDHLGNNLFINDPERAERLHDAAESGEDGSMHCEVIEDWRDYLRNVSDLPEFVKRMLEHEITGVEQWHINNGSFEQVIG